MPTLEELVDGTYRDLADEAKVVFSVLQVEDFIRGGIADLNRVAPSDTVFQLVLTTDPDTDLVLPPYAYDIPIELPYRVEVIRASDGYRWDISAPADGLVNPQGGYTFRRTPAGGTIEFPQWYMQPFDAANYDIRVTGYAVRPLPYTVKGTPTVITAISAANPTVITSTAHGLTTGDEVSIAGSTSTPSVNGTYVVTVLTPNTFTIPVAVTGAGSGGTVTKITSPVVPLSSEEEFSVRTYARSEGYDLLAHDRSLFAQWQGQTNNTDVSPTQMMQMAGNAKQEWDRHRGLIRVVRNYW